MLPLPAGVLFWVMNTMLIGPVNNHEGKENVPLSCALDYNLICWQNSKFSTNQHHSKNGNS